MTPKEKAKELLHDFWRVCSTREQAQKCAELSMREVIQELNLHHNGIHMYYFEEVIEELEKL